MWAFSLKERWYDALGQRLVIEIKRDDIRLATLYYHWSAYTNTAIARLKDLYNHVLVNANRMTDSELRLATIRYAEHSTPYGYFDDIAKLQKMKSAAENETDGASWMRQFAYMHGGVSAEDKGFVQTIFQQEEFVFDDVSRNEGLVSISQESMNNSIAWADGLIEIDLSENMVNFGVLWTYDLEEYLEYLEDMEIEDGINPDDMPEIPIDVSNFELSDINMVSDIMSGLNSEYFRYGENYFQIQ